MSKNNSKMVTVVFLVFMLVAQMALVMLPTSQGAISVTLKTNKTDYSPQETVYITGSGFLAGQTVTLTLTGPEGFSPYTWTVTADDKGKLQTTYSSGLMYGSFDLSATDGTNTAITTFTDFALDSFTVSPDPSIRPLVAGYSYDFTLTATLPGNSGSSGVDVYLITSPSLAYLQSKGITVTFTPTFDPPKIKVAPNQHSGTCTMTISISPDAEPLAQPLTLNAQDNPGAGGNIIGTFTVQLHVNQYSLTIQTNGLTDAAHPAHVTNGTQSGTVSDSDKFEFWYNVDHSTATALAPQFTIDSTVTGAGGIQYLFTGWNDSTSSATHPSITLSDSIGLIATYETQTASVTFYQNGASSDYTGTILTIDPGTSSEVNLGVSDLTGGKTYTWPVGVSHTFAFASPLVVTANSKEYTWTSTGQTGDLPTTQSGTITVSSTGGSVTGNYQTQYYLTVNDGGHGTTGGQGWYTANTNAQATITPLTVNGPTGTRYVFASWTGAASGSNSPSNNILMNSPKTATATWTTQYQVTFAVSPAGAGTTTPSGTDIWNNAGSHTISATPAAGYHFNQWTSDTAAITFLDSDTAMIAGPGTITANFAYNDIAYLVVSADSPQTAGVPFSITVTAVDADGNRIGDYTGTVTFSTTDQGTGISLPNDYTFTSADQGSHTFTNEVTLVTAGSQTITIADNDNELTGQTNVMINANSDAEGSIVITPDPANVEAGKSITFTAILLDIYGNELADVTNSVTWSVDSAAGGNWDQATGTYTAAKASPIDSPWTVTATIEENGICGTADLTVTHSSDVSEIVSITLSPSSALVEAGKTQSYSATALDCYGNVWDVTADVTNANGWSISADAGGSWTDVTYTSEKAGDWTVTGTYEGVSGTARLTVTHSTDVTKIDHIEVSLNPTSVAAPGTVTGTAIAYDIYGNNWAVSTTAVWSITDGNDGGDWLANVYTSHTAGVYTVQALYEGVVGTASLTVTHATDVAYLDHIAASVNPTTVAAPGQVTGNATAYDTLGNSWDVSTVAAWSIPAGNNGGSWLNNVYTSHTAGTYTVEASFGEKTATASLTVTHATDVAYLDHVSIAPKESTVGAGVNQIYSTNAYDSFGNSWPVTATYTSPSAKVVISDNSAYSNTAGSYTIATTFNGKSDSAKLTVTGHLSSVISITVAPKTATVSAGTPRSFTATASDGYNTWDVTNTAAWSILESGHGGSWNQATGTYTSAKAGIWTIQAKLSVLSDTATLTVQPNAELLNYVTIAPKTASIYVGFSQSYSAEAFDAYGNSLGTVSDATTFAAPGATVTGNSVSASSAGSYTVTASYNGKTDTATLTVIATASPFYTLTFTQTGLPKGTQWSITFGGQTKSSTSSTISITVPAGDYNWKAQQVVPLTSEDRYTVYGTVGAQIHVPTATTSYNIKYITQYKLSIISDHGSPIGAQWYNIGDQANFSITSPDVAGDTRYTFTAWSGNLTSTNTNTSIVMNSPKTVIANWQTQYHLTVNSLYGNPTGAGWYDAGTKAQFSVNSPVTDNSGVQQAFASWSGTGAGSYSGTDNTHTVTMDNPITEVATWEPASSLYSVLLIAIIALILILIAVLLAWRRRKKKQQQNQSEVSA